MKIHDISDPVARRIVNDVMAINPGKRFAVHYENGKIRGIGYYHDKEQRFTLVYGKSQVDGHWMTMPPGDLFIDGKLALDPEGWYE